MDFGYNQNSPQIVSMYYFNNMKERNRNHSHLLTGLGTWCCASPGLCKRPQIHAWLLPLCPGPSDGQWEALGETGEQEKGEARVSFPPVAVPWAASGRDHASSAAPLFPTMGPPWFQLPPRGPCESHLLLWCSPHRGASGYLLQ